jgi:polyisoprenoid-binding protein YceI
MSIAAIVVIVIGAIAVAALAYSFLKPTEEASAPIEAVPISESQEESAGSEESDEAEPESAVSESEAQEESSDEDSDEGSDEEPVEEPTSDAQEESSSEEPASSDQEEPTDSSLAGSGPILFQISQDESEARFSIYELLRGDPKIVVGATDQVAGEIQFDPADLSTAQVGTILVNARTLETDDGNRNRALGNRILETGSYEFISFEPTSISGLPDSVSEGETVSFQIIGDLTIKDVTKEVTFEAEVTFVSSDRLEGLAAATVLHDDFGITIPDVPFVADVGEEVELQIEFAAGSG